MTLPNGFRVRLARGLLTAKQRPALVGGSRLEMRLTSRAQARLADGQVTVTDASAHLADRPLATDLGAPELCQVPAVAKADLTVVIPTRDRPAQPNRTQAALRPCAASSWDDTSLF